MVELCAGSLTQVEGKQNNREEYLRELPLTDENVSIICNKFRLDYNPPTGWCLSVHHPVGGLYIFRMTGCQNSVMRTIDKEEMKL